MDPKFSLAMISSYLFESFGICAFNSGCLFNFFLEAHYYNAGIGFCYTFLAVLIDLQIAGIASMKIRPVGL